MPEVPKLSAGYFAAPGMDLIDLFIGAEGTLGVITEATLRVLPARPAVCLAFVTFRDRRVGPCTSSGGSATAAMQTWRPGDATGLDMSAIEHMDARSLALVREDGVDRRLGITLDPHAAMGLLLVASTCRRNHGGRDLRRITSAGGRRRRERGVRRTAGPLAHFAPLLQESACRWRHADRRCPAIPPGAERLLALREAVPLAVNQRVGRAQREVDPRIEKTAADVIVPFERFEEMLSLYEDGAAHAGDSTAPSGVTSRTATCIPNVIPRSFADVESGREAVLAFGREAIRLGGAPLAEHGVGRSPTKQQLLRGAVWRGRDRRDAGGEAGAGPARQARPRE